MAEGDVHYRLMGRVGLVDEPRLRAVDMARQRVLWGHLVPHGVATRIHPDNDVSYDEWFNGGAVRMPAWDEPRPGFFLRHSAHGGVRVGRVLAVVTRPAWTDVAVWVDEGRVGDAFLEEVDDDGSRLPLSMGFEPVSAIPSYGSLGEKGLERTRVILREVAVVDRGAYEGAYLYARAGMDSVTRHGISK